MAAGARRWHTTSAAKCVCTLAQLQLHSTQQSAPVRRRPPQPPQRCRPACCCAPGGCGQPRLWRLQQPLGPQAAAAGAGAERRAARRAADHLVWRQRRGAARPLSVSAHAHTQSEPAAGCCARDGAALPARQQRLTSACLVTQLHAAANPPRSGRQAVPRDEFAANLGAMVDAARAAGIRHILLLTPPPVDDEARVKHVTAVRAAAHSSQRRACGGAAARHTTALGPPAAHVRCCCRCHRRHPAAAAARGPQHARAARPHAGGQRAVRGGGERGGRAPGRAGAGHARRAAGAPALAAGAAERRPALHAGWQPRGVGGGAGRDRAALPTPCQVRPAPGARGCAVCTCVRCRRAHALHAALCLPPAHAAWSA